MILVLVCVGGDCVHSTTKFYLRENLTASCYASYNERMFPGLMRWLDSLVAEGVRR